MSITNTFFSGFEGTRGEKTKYSAPKSVEKLKSARSSSYAYYSLMFWALLSQESGPCQLKKKSLCQWQTLS